MSTDPKELQANQRLERLENRICEVQLALQTLVEGERFLAKHFPWILALIAFTALGALGGMALVRI